MYQLEDLIRDNAVKVGATLFPVMVATDGGGVSPARFYLFRSPDDSDPHWVAAAWKSSMSGGEPSLVFAERVSEIFTFTMRRVDLVLESGHRAVVTPIGGCGCGSRLKSFKPFGPTVRLDQVPTPTT